MPSWQKLLRSHVVLFVLHSIALLWPNEWDVIRRLFMVDQAISIHCFNETTPSGSTTQYTTQPGKAFIISVLATEWQGTPHSKNVLDLILGHRLIWAFIKCTTCTCGMWMLMFYYGTMVMFCTCKYLILLSAN